MMRKNVWTAVVAILFLASTAAAQAKPDLVSQMPADCLGFIVIKNAKTFEIHLRELVEPMGLDKEIPSFEEKSAEELPPIFDLDGSWAVILLAPEEAGGEPWVVGIFPAKNLDEALKQLGEADADGIYSPEGKNTKIMRYRGDYLAQADDRAALIALKNAKGEYKPSEAAAEILKDSEAFGHFNMKAVLAAYRVEMEKAREEMKQEAAGMPAGPMGGPPPKLLQAMPGMIDIFIDAMEQIEAADVGSMMGKEGAMVRSAVTVDEKGSIARGLAAFSALDGKWLPPLPADDFIMAGWAHVDMKKLSDEYLALINYAETKMNLKDLLGEELVAEMKNSIKESGKLMGNRLSGAMSLPADPNQGMFAFTEVFEVTDPEAYRREMERSTALSQKLMGEFFGNLGLGAQAPKMTVKYTPKAEEIAGLQVDHFKMDMEFPLPPDAPPEAKAMMENMIKIMYGPEGLLMRTAIVDNKAIVTLGGREQMQCAIAAVKGQKQDLARNVNLKELAEKMPKDSCAVGFVSAPRYMEMTARMMQKMMAIMMPMMAPPGAEMPPMPEIKIPKTNSAAVASFAVRKNVCRIDIFVPMSEIVGTKQAISELEKAMRPPMPPGPPPGDWEEEEPSEWEE